MISRLLHILLFLLLLSGAVRPQTNSSSHQRDWEFYRDNPEMVGKDLAPPVLSKRTDLASPQVMDKVVYGFHPYWQNGQESNYYFSLLTHIAYFSADVDAATGNFSSTHSWSTANVVTLAQQYGVKVHLSVVLFSSHSTLLASTSSKNNLIANIMTQINLRNADGCNIDFESISGSQATAYRDFLKQLGDTLKAHNKEFVVELFAVDWNTVFPASFFSTLNSVVDYYFIMLYDYYYSGSTTAGPVAPLMNTTSTSYRHVLRSIKAYTDVGAPASKLIAGFPSYGYDWPVVSEVRMASATASATSRTFSISKNNYLDTIAAGDKFRDATFNVPWYRYQSGGTWRQVWYDDSLSWAQKFDSIKVKSVAGTGMWALGYDGTEPELWGALKNSFAQTADPSHTSFDAFESGVGRFDKYPRWSGSTTGIDIASSQAFTNDAANNGLGSLVVVLKDSAETSVNWSVRLNSGGSSRASNVQFAKDGYIGLWMRTNSAPSGAQIAVTIDDQRSGSSDKTELSQKLTVNNDGAWHLYEWNLEGSGWSSFSGGNGVLDSAVLSLDAVMLYAPNGSPDWTLYLDDVSHNTNGPLPVELTSFMAIRSSAGVQLNWSTATEMDNYGFELQRSAVSAQHSDPGYRELTAENREWKEIAFVSGNGTSNNSHQYTFTDRVNSGGMHSYRLRQLDRSGAYRYSAELTIDAVGVPGSFILEQNFPNPFNPVTTIEYRLPVTGRTTLTIYDMLGREVAAPVNEVSGPGTYRFNFDAARLSSGVYFYTLRSGTFVRTRRMQLLK